jgi:phage-related protein
MANSGDDQNLVSQIQVTGDEESAKKIETFADRGAAAFGKLDTAAAKASAGVSASTDAVGKAATGAQKAVGGLNSIDLSRFKDGISRIQDAIGNLNAQFPKLTQSVGRFAQRMSLLAVAAVAAGTKLASAAKGVVAAVDGQSDALDKQTQSQIDANNKALSAEEAQINLASSYRKLNQQLATGQITYQQYSDAIKQLNQDYKEQRRVADEVAAAQARVKDENDRLTKSLAEQKAYNALLDKLGGPLLGALLSFGRTAEQVRVQLVQAFGPGLAGLIDTIEGVISKNSASITQFINTAGAKLTDLVNKNGPQLQKFFENVGKAAASIFNGLIDAAPAIIDLFNNVLVPAVTKVAGLFQTVATAINAVFGTRLTGGSIFLVAVIAQITGSIRLLFALLKSGGAVFKGFTALLEAVGSLLLPLFGGGKISQGILKFGVAITTAGGPLKTLFAILKSGVPLIVTMAEVLGTALGVGLGVSLPLVIALAAALIYLATQVDWKKFGSEAVDALKGLSDWLKTTWENAKAAANGIRGAWQGLKNWFGDIGSSIGSVFTASWAIIVAGWQATVQAVSDAWSGAVTMVSNVVTAIGNFFASLWNDITGGVSSAVSSVQSAWSAVVAWFQTAIITPVVAFFATLWTNVVTGVTDAIKAIQDAWGAVVAFFSDIGTQISTAFQTAVQTIVGYWSSGVEQIKSYFSDLYNSAKQYIQPIIDMLTQLIGLNASAGGSGGDASVNAATGGHITGPGSGTSDSIPAFLSNNEFVVKAKSVAKYGVGMLHAINRGNFQLPRFAEGGLVGPTPAFDFGGVGGSERGIALQPLNLSLFGEEFRGLSMPEDVGRRMTKFAIAKQTRSAGRKPAWVGRGRT